MAEQFSPNSIILSTRSGKTQYSETEAAAELGVSIDDLRSLIRQHIVRGDEVEFRSPPLATFQFSDLVLLRILAGMQADPIDV